jgi:uncharacterized protein YgfB (UPF0149 family)
MSADLDHDELAKTLKSLRLGVNASDLHCSLTGCLCADAHVNIDDWPDVLQLDPGDRAVARNHVLQRLYRSCRSQLERSPPHIAPLLPVRAAPLPQRAGALVEWCRGFLGGFGLGGAIQRSPLSDDATEALRDLGVVAASHFDAADAAADEQALVDVIDFVRASCALLHCEIASRVRTRTLH